MIVTSLQLEIMKSEHQNVEQALSRAIKLEACEPSLTVQSGVAKIDDNRHRRQSHAVVAVSDPPELGESATLCKKVQELQNTLAQATLQMAALATRPWSGRVARLDAASPINSVPDAIAMPPVLACPCGRVG